MEKNAQTKNLVLGLLKMPNKIATFHVTVEVEDHGEFEPNSVRDAIVDGLDRARGEGHLTKLDDTSTEVIGYFVQHTGDMEVDVCN